MLSELEVLEVQETICQMEEIAFRGGAIDPMIQHFYELHKLRDKAVFLSLKCPYGHEEYFKWPKVWSKIRKMQTA